MGRIGVVGKFEANVEDGEFVDDITADVGGGALLTGSAFGPSGDDSPPLPGDYVATTSHPGGEGQAAVAYADPVNAGVAEGGEVRRYARDAAGLPVAWYWLKKTGEAVIANDNGTITLNVDGSVDINGFLTVAAPP